MRALRSILEFIDRDFAFKLILALLLYSLVPLGEIFLFIYIGELIGNYLVLVIAAVAGLAGVPIALHQVPRALAAFREKARKGKPPGSELAHLAGILAAGLLLITPGFVTDLLGYLLLIPGVRRALGRRLARRRAGILTGLFEYLRLREM
jgi:UPF0716 protein FxsA